MKENVLRTIPTSTVLEVECEWWTIERLRRLQRGPTSEISTHGEQEETCDNSVVSRDQKDIDTFHNFLGYVTDRLEAPVETSILSLNRLNLWIYTVFISGKEQRGGGPQKLYSEAYHTMLKLSILQPIQSLRKCVEYWYPE